MFCKAYFSPVDIFFAMEFPARRKGFANKSGVSNLQTLLTRWFVPQAKTDESPPILPAELQGPFRQLQDAAR